MKPFNENNPTDLTFTQRQALHGDVIIEKVESLPEDFDKMESEKNSALAYGEMTGHLHKLFRISDKEGADLPAFELKIGPEGIRFLKVNELVVLKHQEHEPRVIPVGLYKTSIQREYDVFLKRARSVAD